MQFSFNLLPLLLLDFYFYVVLPKMFTETGKKSFAYQGARIFNRLEKTTRDEISILLFKKKLKLSKSL